MSGTTALVGMLTIAGFRAIIGAVFLWGGNLPMGIMNLALMVVECCLAVMVYNAL